LDAERQRTHSSFFRELQGGEEKESTTERKESEKIRALEIGGRLPQNERKKTLSSSIFSKPSSNLGNH